MLASYIGIIIGRYTDSYEPISIMECQRVVITAHVFCNHLFMVWKSFHSLHFGVPYVPGVCWNSDSELGGETSDR